jgi:hypothetical protein
MDWTAETARVCSTAGDDRRLLLAGRPSHFHTGLSASSSSPPRASLSVLATRPALVKRLIVSDTHAKKFGIYTVKFSKAGVWRYVHVDDRLPCNRSGTVQYARSKDPNEVWVMIIEKAYAKLHGCYEAITAGCVRRRGGGGRRTVARWSWRMDGGGRALLRERTVVGGKSRARGRERARGPVSTRVVQGSG